MKDTYIAFLRGINVGGHHKVPMQRLRDELKNLEYDDIATILNSGNIIFSAKHTDELVIEETLSAHLEKVFGFPIPTIVRRAEEIMNLLKDDPFKNYELTKEKRFYVSLLKSPVETDLELPWTSEDGSYHIISKADQMVCSVLDLSISNTPKAMEAAERFFGKEMTTRNWKTILRIQKKLVS